MSGYHQIVGLLTVILPILPVSLVPDSRVSNVYSQSEQRIVSIDKTFNLGGGVWRLPKRTTVIFKNGGAVCNGSIVFDETTIVANAPCFASGLSFSGSLASDVDIKWFGLRYGIEYDNSESLNAALQLASLSPSHTLLLPMNQIIYVKSHFDEFDPSLNDGIKYLRKGSVCIPSDTIFDLNGSTIKCLPNNKQQYNILFSRESHGITVINGIIEGDSSEHKYLSGSNEWGYGIEFQGVHDFLIQNVICKGCTGDGIDLQASLHFSNGNLYSIVNCVNGRIIDCKSVSNGRNALSIQGCEGLTVLRSEFSSSNRTAPKSGIDIEPSISHGVVKNIQIQNCSFTDNGAYGIMLHKIGPKVSISNIHITNCRFSSKSSNYHVLNNGGTDIYLDSCSFITNVREPGQIRVTGGAFNIHINKCYSQVNSGLSILLDGKVSSCIVSDCVLSRFKVQKYKDEPIIKDVQLVRCNLNCEGAHYCFMEHANNLQNVSILFDSCVLEYSKSVFTNLSQRVFILPQGNNVTYRFRNCVFKGNGSKITLSNSLSITDSVLDNTIIEANVEEGSVISFTNNALKNHVDINRSAITIHGNKGVTFYGDFSGLRIISSRHALKSIINANNIDTSQIRIDNYSKIGQTKLIQN